MPITIHCPICDGQNVKRDAFAEWNPELQMWEIAQVFDAGFCDDCGHEVSLVEKEAAA